MNMEMFFTFLAALAVFGSVFGIIAFIVMIKVIDHIWNDIWLIKGEIENINKTFKECGINGINSNTYQSWIVLDEISRMLYKQIQKNESNDEE